MAEYNDYRSSDDDEREAKDAEGSVIRRTQFLLSAKAFALSCVRRDDEAGRGRAEPDRT